MTEQHIKIENITPKIQYIGDGIQTEFHYPFVILDQNHIQIYYNEALQETGYSVLDAGNQNGGTVLFDQAPQDQIIITILRALPIERLSDYQTGGELRASILNDDFDRLTMIAQELDTKLNTTLKAPITSNASITLPYPEARRALIWNADGNNLINSTYDPDLMGEAQALTQKASEYAEQAAIQAEQAAMRAESAASALQQLEAHQENAFYGFKINDGHLILDKMLSSDDGVLNKNDYADCFIANGDLQFTLDKEGHLYIII